MVVPIQITGMGKARNIMTGYTRTIPNAANNAAYLISKRLAKEMRLEAAKRKHVTTGYLAGKGIHEKKLAKGVWAVVAPYYLPFLEKGTRPHWIPRKRITELWAKKHGMTFYWFRNIVAKYGTRPHPFTSFVIHKESRRSKRIAEKEINKAVVRKGKR